MPAAQPMTVQMVAVDEPGVESGKDVGGRPDDLGVDGHDRGADDPITSPLAGQRIEPLDRQRPAHSDQWDADFGCGFDEGLFAHPARGR